MRGGAGRTSGGRVDPTRGLPRRRRPHLYKINPSDRFHRPPPISSVPAGRPRNAFKSYTRYPAPTKFCPPLVKYRGGFQLHQAVPSYHMAHNGGRSVRVRMFASKNFGLTLTRKKSKRYQLRITYRQYYPFLTDLKLLCREGVSWSHLNHPNIVPFRGVTLEPPQLVSEWISGTELRVYARGNPHAILGLVSPPRSLSYNASLSLQLLGIAEGLAYLHSRDIIHGDLNGVSVVVDLARPF